MRARLLLGPPLIVALLALFWLDETFDRTSVPGWAIDTMGGRTTFPPGVVLLLVATGLVLLAAQELTRLMRDKGVAASRRVMSFAALSGLWLAAFVPGNLPTASMVPLAFTVAVLVLLGSLLFYARHRTVEGTLAAVAGSLLSFVYLGLMAGFLILIRREHSAWVLLWVIFTTKSCDIGAYFTGKSLGRHKLIPWLSPAKTWEGLAGGLVVAAAIGTVGLWTLSELGMTAEPVWPTGPISGVVFGLVGHAGDLIVSVFKRDAGRKDAGASLPGFGGMLDVMDSPLLVAPVAFWMLHAWA